MSLQKPHYFPSELLCILQDPSPIIILTSWWVSGRVGGGGHGLIFGQMGSNYQSRVGGGMHSGSRVGLPRIHSCAAVKTWAQVDKRTDHRLRRGGRAGSWRDLAADQGEAEQRDHPACTGPYLQDVSRKEMFTSQWVWTLQGKKQRVSVACRTRALDSRVSVWQAPISPRAPAPKALGWLGLSPGPSGTSSTASSCHWDRLKGQKPAPDLSRQGDWDALSRGRRVSASWCRGPGVSLLCFLCM